MDALPNEVVACILDYARDNTVALVCKLWCNIAHDIKWYRDTRMLCALALAPVESALTAKHVLLDMVSVFPRRALLHLRHEYPRITRIDVNGRTCILYAGRYSVTVRLDLDHGCININGDSVHEPYCSTDGCDIDLIAQPGDYHCWYCGDNVREKWQLSTEETVDIIRAHCMKSSVQEVIALKANCRS